MIRLLSILMFLVYFLSSIGCAKYVETMSNTSSWRTTYYDHVATYWVSNQKIEVWKHKPWNMVQTPFEKKIISLMTEFNNKSTSMSRKEEIRKECQKITKDIFKN